MKKDEPFKRVSISEAEYEQLNLREKKIKSAKMLKRIQAFKLMYLGWKYSAIAEFLSVTNNTITNWINLYIEGGIDSLLTFFYKGGQANLSEKQLSKLKNEASKGSFAIAKDVQRYIKQNFGVEYNLSHVQLLCKKNFNYPLRKQD
ncbi:MAG: helix-turn-helix domain-containing protein [Candidatus Methanoperedens sp.]|nr:helix-turn-helix domain-containing protein [Candidatus Methanoperedens sp.]